MTKACVSLNWHHRRQTCWVLRREGWRSACCHELQCVAAVYSPWCISVASVKFPLMKRQVTRSPVKVPVSTETVKGVGWKLETIGVTHPLWKISGYATATRNIVIFITISWDFSHRSEQYWTVLFLTTKQVAICKKNKVLINTTNQQNQTNFCLLNECKKECMHCFNEKIKRK